MHSTSELHDGSRVAVVGGGPAGSFFSYFLLQIARRAGLELRVEIYEPRDFSVPGPKGCNMCGGIISESLAQNLAAEGINLPAAVVQRGINSYMLHMDAGSVRIETPLQEMRIAAVHRGGGPRGLQGEAKYRGLDGYLLDLAVTQGAQLVRKKVESVGWENGRPRIKTQDGWQEFHDLIAIATGVNSSAWKLFEGSALPYRPPETTKTYICELCLGHETIEKHLGSSMHVFLLNIPRLEFAALIPKGDYVTLCLLGQDIDKVLVESFMNSPEVKRCLPPNWRAPEDFCHCSPRICTEAATHLFADRVVFVGDCGVTRLFKDGIGAAYRTSKAAAIAAVFEGVSGEVFRRYYGPVCRTMRNDNRIGKLVFAVTRQIQMRAYLRRGVWQMVSREQRIEGSHRRMSMVLWDTFTGSAPYRDVFMRCLHPAFWGRLLWETVVGNWPFHRAQLQGRAP